MTTRKTQGEASKLLAEYRQANPDLDKETAHLLGMFALAFRVGKDALEALYDRPLGQTPWRHRAWFWWTAMRSAGLSRYWPEFVRRRNKGDAFDGILNWLKRETTEEEWDTLSRRIKGPEPLYPGDYTHAPRDEMQNIWTKGGTWIADSAFTKIIILGEPVERDYSYNRITRALGPAGARQLEREIRGFVDPDKDLEPHARWKAVEYVRNRMPKIIGWDDQSIGPRTISWFFQEPIPEGPGSKYYWDWRWSGGVDKDTRRKIDRNGRVLWWAWLPPEET